MSGRQKKYFKEETIAKRSEVFGSSSNAFHNFFDVDNFFGVYNLECWESSEAPFPKVSWCLRRVQLDVVIICGVEDICLLN